MCHSGKHTAGICIQDNETCHVNFILCLHALFVLSLFFALRSSLFPPFGFYWMKVPCSGQCGSTQSLLRFHSDEILVT